APSRAEHLRTVEHRIDFGVRVGLVDVDVIGEDVDASLVELPFHHPVMIDRVAEPPRTQLLAGGLRADSRTDELRLDPGSMQLYQPHAVLNEPPDQCGPVLRRHREIVVAERLQPELYAADHRPIVPSTPAWLHGAYDAGSADAENRSGRADDRNPSEFATRH